MAGRLIGMPVWARLASIAALSFVVLSIARAQDAGVLVPAAPVTETPVVVDDPEPVGPTPEQQALLESTHITELAQRTRVALRDTRPLLHDDTDVLRIARALPAEEAQVAILTAPVHIAQIAHMSQRELAEHRRTWRARREQYEDWQAILATHAGEIEAARTALVELRRTWRALRDAEMADPGRSESRLDRIATAIQQVREAANTLETQRDAVQALEDRVSDLVITTTDVGDDIRDALDAYREQLLVRDRPPIWQGLGEPIVNEGDLPIGEHLQAQSLLLGEQSAGITRLAVAIALLAGLIAALRRHVARQEGAAELAPALALAAMPIATALVVGLLASGLVVPNAPVFFGDVVAVVIVAPIVWIAWPRLDANLRALVALVAVLVVSDRIEGTLNDGSVVRRALVLGESIAFGGALATLARREATTPLARRARVLAIVAAMILALAALANVLGYAFLATVLVRGTAFSLGGALSLVTAFAIFDALVGLSLATRLLRHSNGVRHHRALILARIDRGLVLALSLAWIVLVLGGYGLATPFFSWLDDTLQAHGSFGTLDLSLGEILGASLVLAVSWVVTRFVLFVLELDLLPRLKLEPGVGGAIAGLTRYLLFSLGIVLSLATLGIDASQIALVAGALGVGVGFGLQGIVANFIAGLVLMIERPVRLGDKIEVGTLLGYVDRIGLRSSTVRAEDGAEVIVPNETLIGREVVNWTLSDRKRRVEIPFGVAYGTEPRRVVEVVLKAVRTHERVLAKSTGASDPAVHFTAFGPSSLDFVVRVWTEEGVSKITSEVGLLVLDALTEAKIEIPFPQQDVRVVSVPSPAVIKS